MPSDLEIWLCDLTYTQQTIAADVIPNAIGGICTYTEKHVALSKAIRLFKYPEKLIEALEEGRRPDIIGFSNYVWNFTLSYRFAELLKRHAPGTIVVFGGPNYPTMAPEQEEFLRRHPAIDFYIVREGELAFANLVQALIEADCDIEAAKRRSLASVHSVGADGSARLVGAIERITDLSTIPSPYLTGHLDPFFDGRLLPIIQTNRGCPFSCTFCVEGEGYYNKVRRNGQQKVHDELVYIGSKMNSLRTMGSRNDLFIADSNFGMYREDLDTARSLAETRKTYGWPEYINVATGKNQKERVLEASRIIDGALRLSGSVQSLDPGVLENIKRKNIDAEGLYELGLKSGEVGANTYSEIILALPGDSLDSHLSTIRTVMTAGFTNIYLFQLMLLPGTEMATRESRAGYGMVPRYRVLPRCYGDYEVLGERVVAAEIEEICVASNTLPFDDYLQARRFHLVITVFYNDGVFASLLKLLRDLDVPIYRWMEALQEEELPEGLKPLFESFTSETQDELWESREALEEFVMQDGVVERFIAGDLGNNLLFVHKTVGITRYLEALAVHAERTIIKVLAEFGHDSQQTRQFVRDALVYHCASARDLFTEAQENPTAVLTYDIAGYLRSGVEVTMEDALLSAPTRFEFLLDDSQRELIRRYKGIYGDSPVAIGRILSKVHVKKLFRHALPEYDSDAPPIAGAAQGDFLLSGLQQ